jgi:hypothetical protein
LESTFDLGRQLYRAEVPGPGDNFASSLGAKPPSDLVDVKPLHVDVPR